MAAGPRADHVDIEITQASQADAPVLAALAELYIYDFTEFTGEDPGDDGRFPTDWLARLWTEPDHYAFIARIDGKLAAFALIRRGSEFVDESTPWNMAEFFVMRKYRRSGVGRALATAMFDRFRGPWQVHQIAANAPAQAFWRRIIGDYTHGTFEERILDDAKRGGPVQLFESSA
jgi:predicted acetyltransferase